jgi:predicted nucleic acid-binding protein
VLLLDASVWVAAKDGGDRYFDSAQPIVLDPVHPVAALDLTFYEVANALGARRGQHAAAAELCRTIVERCPGTVLAVDQALVEAALEIAAEHELTAYDAAYVAAARRHDWTLVSADIADLVSKGLAVAPDAADYPLSQ